MYSRSGMRQGSGGGGLTGPVPRDLWILLGIVFVTFSLQFFKTTAWIPNHLRLTPEVWQRGFLWQLVTFEFVGTGREPDLWFLLSLLILFMFGRDLIVRLGAKDFWKFLVLASAFAGVIAVAVQLLIVAFGFTSVAKLLLNRLHLLAQDHFTLPITKLLLNLRLDILLRVQNADLPLHMQENLP